MRLIFALFLAGFALATPGFAQSGSDAANADTETAVGEAVALAQDTASEEGAVEGTLPIAGLEPRDAREVSLDTFRWIARPIIVFADTPADPRFIEQMDLLSRRLDPLLEREVVILFDTDPDARSEIRTALRPRGFSLVVLQKDGSVGFRRPSPRDVREITRGIDNFSLRQEELRSGGG